MRISEIVTPPVYGPIAMPASIYPRISGLLEALHDQCANKGGYHNDDDVGGYSHAGWLLVIGYSLLVIGYSLLVIGY